MEYISGFQNDEKNPDSFIVMIIIIVVIAKEVKKNIIEEVSGSVFILMTMIHI